MEITVTNHLTVNGTGIHWHGMRQLGSNEMDGVNGITECPIAPGETKLYRFKATQYGTTVSRDGGTCKDEIDSNLE
jgi:FtsP/CotA-like multicopper oxidase with cupredoxin domain